MKQGLKKTQVQSTHELFYRFLARLYRIIPHSTTGVAQAELLLRHRPRSHLDLFWSDSVVNVHKAQAREKAAHDHCAKPREIKVRR